MSSKNTPAHGRSNNRTTARNGLGVRGGGGGGGLSTPGLNAATPAELRRKIAARIHSTEGNCISGGAVEPEERRTYSDQLNTAFRAAVTTPGTPRFKNKATALNACYTPSSLYRSTKAVCTPSSVRSTHTPSATKSHNGRSIRAKSSAAAGGSTEDPNTEISNLAVAVRVRPLNAQECSKVSVKNAVRVRQNELTIVAGTNADASAGVTHSFVYDHVFDSSDPESRQFACQDAVFAGTARPLIDRAFEGYNACLFAYGQTGSGKSYSMMGIEALDDDALDGGAPHPEAGIIPRFCHELFRRIEAEKERVQAEIEISYFEIYNEKIHDLLSVAHAEASCSMLNGGGGSGASTPMQQRQALKVREHPMWGPYVVDLSVHPVDSYAALRNWLAVGNSQRATAATGMNDKSSRSHSILNIVLNLSDADSDLDGPPSLGSPTGAPRVRQTRRSKISLVDLAGSERISASGTNGDRIREGVSINKSLLTLGKVIAALSDAKKNPSTAAFVPYRESVLTWLLRENLGGNSKTVMLATISPASLHIDETLATLRYACQARSIVNRVKVNESPHDKIIRELRAEVDRLKSLRNEYERQKRFSGNSNPTPRKIIIETSVDDSEVEALRQQLAEREKELSRAQKSWMERLQEAEDQRKSELRLLKRKGLALELSSEQKQACLVNLAADPILSGTLFYIIPAGVVRIGRTRTSTYCSQPDIVLDGPLVGYHHCLIENEDGKLYVKPESEDFETYLNGELVFCRKQMYHGDRLVIGGSHYFRISNPFCTQRHQRDRGAVIDFQLAHQEVLHKQEEKLRRELEEEKRVALSRIELERVENECNFKERLQQLELEQLKFNCNREILETERKALQEESTTARAQLDEALTFTSSYKSTLLEDIDRIMQNPSKESLHKTQLMVKEATQYCRNLGMQLEFRQSHVLDEFGIFRTVVLLVDKEQGQKAEWPLARLSVWLDIVRDIEHLDATNIFNSVDIDWQPLDIDPNETLSDSLNASRISLNLSVVKEFVLKQPMRQISNIFASASPSASSPSRSRPQTLTKNALLNCSQRQFHTKKMLTYDDDALDQPKSPKSPKSSKSPTHAANDVTAAPPSVRESFDILAAGHIRDMQRSALRLKKLCDEERENQPRNADTEKAVREAIERLEGILHGMRSCLDLNILVDGAEVSPTKTPKSVRFLID